MRKNEYYQSIFVNKFIITNIYKDYILLFKKCYYKKLMIICSELNRFLFDIFQIACLPERSKGSDSRSFSRKTA